MAPLRYAAKFDPFLSLDCARVEGVGAQSKERKGSNFAAQRSGAIVQKPKGPNTYDLKIWLFFPSGNHGIDQEGVGSVTNYENKKGEREEGKKS